MSCIMRHWVTAKLRPLQGLINDRWHLILLLYLHIGLSSCQPALGTQMRLASSEHRNSYVDYATLAHMAYLVCQKLQQPEHCAAFAQAGLHSFCFIWGFGKLPRRPSETESRTGCGSRSFRRDGQLRSFQEVLERSQWQHIKPGAFSASTLRMMADCCKKTWPESPFINISLPRILKSHESWCSTLASLLTR